MYVSVMEDPSEPAILSEQQRSADDRKSNSERDADRYTYTVEYPANAMVQGVYPGLTFPVSGSK